jgi:hypothetical protein
MNASITKQQVRQAINEILIRYGVDNLELEISLTEQAWALAQPNGDKPEHQRLTSDQARQDTLNALGRGSIAVEDITGAVYQHFRINIHWETRTGRQFLEWLVCRQAEGQTVETFAAWWKRDDWRGKTGQPPSMQQMYELWPQAFIDTNQLGKAQCHKTNGNGLDESTRVGLAYLNNNGPRGRLTSKVLADLRGKYGDAWLVEHGVTWANKVTSVTP